MNSNFENGIHTQTALLLDEYATNELEPDEHDRVEQHIIYCQECQQQLKDIQKFRVLLGSIASNAIQYSDKESTTIMSDENISLAEIVREKIGEQKIATPSTQKRKTVEKPAAVSLKLNQKKSNRVGNMAAAFFAALLVGSIIFTLTHVHQASTSGTPGFLQKSTLILAYPVLEKLELVSKQAFGTQNEYMPNSWGVQKNRIIRTTAGDIFTVFISQGSGVQDRQWHLMHKAPDGGWQEIKTGDAGAEPINILRGPHDEIHLFAWPGNQGRLQHLVSSDNGRSFQTEWVPGSWAEPPEQGYSGSGINGKGDIIFFQTGTEKPGVFNWTYYNATKQTWTFHHSVFDYRYSYAFVMPGENNDLTMVAMRDVKRQELGYPTDSNHSFDYIYNAIKYFHVSNADNPNSTFTQTIVKEIQPQHNEDYNITYLTDSYIDTQGQTHILYNNLYDGPHHAIVENGHVIKDVKQDITTGNKMRIIQDTKGRFYIISIDDHGSLNIYPGSSSDTDGTQLDPVVKLNISQYPGCTDYDFCHSPTFTVPRSGNALADYIDGVYGNHQNELYFRVRLR